jgi:hypothetical protein
MDRPMWPINSLVREGDTGPYCLYCDSSLKLNWKWLWLKRTKHCVQPDCENYYGRTNGLDYN